MITSSLTATIGAALLSLATLGAPDDDVLDLERPYTRNAADDEEDDEDDDGFRCQKSFYERYFTADPRVGKRARELADRRGAVHKAFSKICAQTRDRALKRACDRPPAEDISARALCIAYAGEATAARESCRALELAERSDASTRARRLDLRREYVARYSPPGTDPSSLPQHELDRVYRHACVESFANTRRTSGAAANLLQVAAQVVVDRASQAGWRLLKKQLTRVANCEPPRQTNRRESERWRLRRTCDVLERTNIQDILANPTALVNASIEDLFLFIPDVLPRPRGPQHEFIARTLEITTSASTAVRADGLRGLEAASERPVIEVLHYAADQASCDDTTLTPATRITRALVDCITENSASDIDVRACDMERRLRTDCQLQPSLAREYATVLNANPEVLKFRGLRDRVNVLFELARVDASLAGDVSLVRARDLEAARHLLVGLLDRDWTTATAAAGELMLARAQLRRPARATTPIAQPAATANALTTSPTSSSCDPALPEGPSPATHADNRQACGPSDRSADCRLARNLQKFYALLTAIGQYATTLESAKPGAPDRAETTAARAAIIEELIKRTVSRSARPNDSVVVSIGGSLGLGGSARFSTGTRAYAGFVGPLYIGLGFALDSYHQLGRRDTWGGVHAELSFFELGQYLTFETNGEQGELVVKTPDIKQAVSLGLKLGFWTALRETPLFIAPYVTIAPFSLTQDEHFSWSVGGMLGIYIPFFDFN